MMQLLSAQLYLVTWDSQPVPGVPSLPYIWLNKWVRPFWKGDAIQIQVQIKMQMQMEMEIQAQIQIQIQIQMQMHPSIYV